MDILIIKLGAIGDVIRTTCILQGLKEKYPGCKIRWVTGQASIDTVLANPQIDLVCLIDKLHDKIKKLNYDLVISLDDETDACRLAGSVKSKKIIGAYIEDGKRVYTQDSSLWFDMGLISRLGKEKADSMKGKNKLTYQEIMYKILGLNYKKQLPSLSLGKKNLDFAKKFSGSKNISGKHPVVGINTGAGGRWEGKKLSEEKTAGIIGKIKLKFPESSIILFGGPEEKERNKKILALCGKKAIDGGCDNPLLDFAALVNLCDLIVTSDSLALHIGVALRKKIIVFFCPTPAAEIELYGKGVKITARKGCLCCYKRECVPPPDYDINEITESARKLLK